jgi:hypothetical protein
MNRLNSFFNVVIGTFVVSFFSLIVFVSILGENHRVDDLVTQFFNDMKDGNYEKICPYFEEKGEESEECRNRLFFLELSMLSRFGLLDRDDYSLVITTDHFWVPFVTGGSLDIGITLTEKKKNMFEQWMEHFDNDDKIDRFMTVERRGGTWEITKVRLDDPRLAETMEKLKTTLDVNRYIEKTEKGYAFKAAEIDLNSMNHEEKRLFDFSMKKISGKAKK